MRAVATPAGLIPRARAAVVGAFVGASATACANIHRAAPGQPGPWPAEVTEVVEANRALGDPHLGRFPFLQAVAGLPTQGRLHAILVTTAGEVDCTLDPGHAPVTVANFVGLARGVRPWKDADGTWRTSGYYVDMPFHRAVEAQFVQTGRRGKLAHGGFFVQDEISVGDSFDVPGMLAMAGTGTEHSGSVQFFITTAAAPQLEGKHTIFGRCDDAGVVRGLEAAVTRGATGDAAPRLREIRIERRS